MKKLITVLITFFYSLHCMHTGNERELLERKQAIINNNQYIQNDYYYVKAFKPQAESLLAWPIISSDGCWIATRDYSDQDQPVLQVYNTDNVVRPINLLLEKALLTEIVFSPSNRLMAFKPNNTRIVIYDLFNQRVLNQIETEDQAKIFVQAGYHEGIVTESSNSGQSVSRKRISIWAINSHNSECINSYETDKNICYGFSEKILMYSSNNDMHKAVEMFAIQDYNLNQLFCISSDISKIVFSPDNNFFATLSSNKTTVSIFAAVDGTLLNQMNILDANEDRENLPSMFFTPDNQKLIVHLHQYHTKRTIPLIKAPKIKKTSVVKIWNLTEHETSSKVQTIHLHQGPDSKKLRKFNVRWITANNHFLYAIYIGPDEESCRIQRWDLRDLSCTRSQWLNNCIDRILFSRNYSRMFAETPYGKMYMLESPLALSEEQLHLLNAFTNELWSDTNFYAKLSPEYRLLFDSIPLNIKNKIIEQWSGMAFNPSIFSL